MADELNLTLPKRPPEPAKPRRFVAVVVGLLVALGVANLVATWRRGRGGPSGLERAAALGPAKQKQLALKLERQGLHAAAVRAWRAYLAGAELSDAERANVWYRIGKIHQDAGRHEEALESFYTSESIATADELGTELPRRVRECLEALGNYAALRHELAQRVDLGKALPEEDLVAEIGPQKITRARLDQMIQKDIDRQLADFGALMPPEERKRQKEALVKRFSSPKARLRMLEQLISEEVLVREAIDSKLVDEAETRDLLAHRRRRFLARRVVQKELAEKVKILPIDVENHYKAHPQDYTLAARAKASHIVVKDEAAAQGVLKRLRGGAKFEALAKELSLDADTKAQGGEIPGWIGKGAPIPGIGPSDEAAAAIFATEAGQVASRTVKTKRGVHIFKVRERQPERLRPFQEVRDEAYDALRREKMDQAQKALLGRLRQRYDVVVHYSRFAPGPPEGERPGGRSPAPKPTPKTRPGKKR